MAHDHDQLPVVRPRRAFAWDCPGCQTENLDRTTEVIFDTPEEEEEVREQLGMEPDDKVVTTPETVTCRNCLMMVRLSVCDCHAHPQSEGGGEFGAEPTEEYGTDDGDDPDEDEVDGVE